ncbi:AAA family ATPase [Arhodomonas sp. AD133]|uniref:AAA family ATPase n=1 Tax=Arhodomonas sp. AD133 TaxID=3415009 RepID=UPI003EC00021
MTHRFVITGGPGAGKTTVLATLEERGYHCVPESAREMIRCRLLLTLQEVLPDLSDRVRRCSLRHSFVVCRHNGLAISRVTRLDGQWREERGAARTA